MKHFEVTAAIIIYHNRVLCMQRPEDPYDYISLKYEFPGGKIEEGETSIEALKREIEEELALSIEVSDDDYFMYIEHKYPDFSIVMHSYICHVDTNKIDMKAHVDYKWIRPTDLLMLDWVPADIPIVERLVIDSK